MHVPVGFTDKFTGTHIVYAIRTFITTAGSQQLLKTIVINVIRPM